MSEPKLISPMLDNFYMGDPISEHDGVRCCPAMERDTNEKYIVKIISVPASQVQLNALLLTGAYPDQESALSYFKKLSDGILEEAQVLQRLAQLEGFLPYESWQAVPMEDGTGYDVYLLSPYQKTLEKHFKRNPMTHLGAINLGLDMCAALAVCRRSGYLYVDLKPSNIYMSDDHEYRIGDLGFLKLDGLKYASLPDKYRSQYTAPEISDAFSSINTTVDIYAAGLILYQAYNDGILPSFDGIASGEAFPAPAYADYEMAEIILKAISPDPQDRWQDPIEMGQALISYMQRNGANDIPIVPVPVAEEAPVDEEEVAADAPDVEINTADAAAGASEEEPATEDSLAVDVPDDSFSVDEIAEPSEGAEELSPDEVTEESIYTEDSFGNLTFLEDSVGDETTPDHHNGDIEYNEVSEEVSDILTHADELISHPAPDPVIPPEPIDVPIPAPLPLETDGSEEPEETADGNSEEAPADTEANEADESDNEAAENNDDGNLPPSKKRSGHWVRNILIAALIAALLFVGFYYYQHYYLQPVSMVLEGNDGILTVVVTSQIDESKLTVICSDTYGNQLKSPVVDGKAVFTDLTPNSAYTVNVVIDGFHRLTGTTSTAYTTPVITNIVQFNAVTGTEDGSVILGFTPDGPDSEQWTVICSAPGEEDRSVTFSGHMVTLSQLTIGTEYKFTLIPVEELFISGNTEITFTASKLVRAEGLTITGCSDNKLTAAWNAPQDTSVQSWTVRCYNDAGFDETVTTADTSIVFEEIDTTNGYTLEVTALGMSVSERTYVSKNAVTVSNIRVDTSDPNKLLLTWDSNLTIADKGWIVLYTVDGSAAQEVVSQAGNSVEISPVVPGAAYQITLQTVDASNVFGGTYSYTAPEAETFTGYSISAENMDFYMCRRPTAENWDRHDLSASDYVTGFTTDEKISFVVRMRKVYDTTGGDITILYVIRDANGNIVNASAQLTTWTSMWDYYYCELDLPYTPTAAGEYNISIYFNGYYVEDLDFTMANAQ